MTKTDIRFEKVTARSEQINVLFKLLSDRVHSISHQKVVSFTEHQEFVRANIYREWFLVKLGEKYIGSFYLTNENMLGVNIPENKVELLMMPILNFIKLNYEPLVAIPSVRSDRFAINVPPSNARMSKSLQKLGFELAQLTYYLPN